jgi:hypothetical protein
MTSQNTIFLGKIFNDNIGPEEQFHDLKKSFSKRQMDEWQFLLETLLSYDK